MPTWFCQDHERVITHQDPPRPDLVLHTKTKTWLLRPKFDLIDQDKGKTTAFETTTSMLMTTVTVATSSDSRVIILKLRDGANDVG